MRPAVEMLDRATASAWRRRLREVLGREMVADLVVAAGGASVALTGLVAGWANVAWRLGIEDRTGQVVATALVAGLLFVPLRRYARRQTRPLGDARAHLLADLRTLLFLFGLFLATTYLTKTADAFSRGWVVSWFAAAILALFLLRLFVAKWVVPRAAGLLAHRIAVVGPAEGVEALRRSLPREADLELVAALSGDVDEVAERIAHVAAREPVDEVVLAVPERDGAAVRRWCDALVAVPADISLWLGEGVTWLARLGPFDLDPLPRQLLLRRPIRDWGRIAKGVMDRVGAAVLLLVLAPLFGLIALAIKLDSPGPVFYRQLRCGRGREPFLMWKFRSMYSEVCDAPDAPIRQATRDDPRVTRVGRWLRRTSLDELPQLINVLRGEMSLVGPRPHPVRMDEIYEPLVERYMARYRIKPGITGWAQIHGHRGETPDLGAMQARVAYDLEYVRSWSFALDLWILLLTPWVVLTRRNAY